MSPVLPARAPGRATAVARVGLAYLLCSGALHAAPVVLLLAVLEPPPPAPTRVRLLEPAAQAALDRREAEAERRSDEARRDAATAADPIAAGDREEIPPRSAAVPDATAARAASAEARKAPPPPGVRPPIPAATDVAPDRDGRPDATPAREADATPPRDATRTARKPTVAGAPRADSDTPIDRAAAAPPEASSRETTTVGAAPREPSASPPRGAPSAAPRPAEPAPPPEPRAASAPRAPSASAPTEAAPRPALDAPTPPAPPPLPAALREALASFVAPASEPPPPPDTPRVAEPPPPAARPEPAPPTARPEPPRSEPLPRREARARRATGEDDEGDGRSADGETWLRYARGEGPPSDEVDPNARYVSGRNSRAPEETRAPADIARSNGDGGGDAPLATRVTRPPDAGPARPAETAVLPAAPAPEAEVPRPIPDGSDDTRAPPTDRPGAARPRAGRVARTAPPTAPARAVSAPVDVVLPLVTPAAGPAPEASGAGVAVGEIPSSEALEGVGVASRRTNAGAPRRAPPPPSRPAATERPGDGAADARADDARVSTTANRAVHGDPIPVPSARAAAPLADDFWSAPTRVPEPLPEATDAVPVERAPDDPDPTVTALSADETARARGWADLSIVDERAERAERARFSARAHPVGAWGDAVVEQLAPRWRYPPELRALGIEGTVVVRFRVGRDGAVSQLEVQSGSGVPDLDVAALAAVPARVAPLPAEAGRSLLVQYVFRYRDAGN